jgi:Na+-transporting NADH:ubiquinone oxidoreductase subunit C
MKGKAWYPVVYMFAVTAFFSSVIISFAELTRGRVEANAQLAFEKAVLAVLPGMGQEQLSNIEVHRVFSEQVNEPDESSGGAYTLKKDGKVAAYALMVSGQGFWAPIKAVIGIDSDGVTLTGAVFYEQNETPGLGGEIAKTAFQEQFKAKVLSTGSKAINFKRGGEILGDSDVHAVTGATQTSVRVEAMINTAINEWRVKMSSGVDAE